MTAKEYLIGIARLDREVSARLEQVEKLRVSVGKARPLQKSGEKGTYKSYNWETELLCDLERLLALKQEADRCIARFTNPDYRALLRLRYLCANSWSEVADKMHYSVTHIHRMHNLALAEFTLPASARAAG